MSKPTSRTSPRTSSPPLPASGPRRLLTAELVAVGSELLVGETRDTNSGEIARWLSTAGVRVGRLTAVPDDLAVVRGAFEAALERSDLVISTGGLGPTPDDLTREAIAALAGETPAVDPALERWLRDLWARRGMPFPEINIKQAWLIPSATALANRHGTAPGWWVDRPDGRVVLALPGPPREMGGIWSEEALPRLQERGLGQAGCVRTYRLAGIGESQVADLLGEELLRAANPVVATYARAEAVDVRISAVAEGAGAGGAGGQDGRPGRSAEELVDAAEAKVLAVLGRYVWGRDDETWAVALGKRLERLGWTLATSETGTGGALIALLAGVPWIRMSESLSPDSPAAATERTPEGLAAEAMRVRERGGAEVGIAVRVEAAGKDTRVHLAVVTPGGVSTTEQVAFLGAAHGRRRSALQAAAFLLERLREAAGEADLA